MRFDLCLSGFGNIGRHFVRQLGARRGVILNRYNLDLRLVTVVGSAGGVHKADGLDLDELLALAPGSAGLTKSPFWSEKLAGPAGIMASSAGILVEATPTDIWTGEPGLSHFRTALAKGMDIVTFAKGPLVKAFTELRELACANGCRLKLSGATAAALPTLDVGTFCLAGDDLLSFEGVLNGTSNYVLSRMIEDKLSYEAALAEAVAQGVAEPDPRLDVEGWDTMSKTIILANCLFDTQIDASAVPVTGIQQITLQDLLAAKARGEALRLVGSAVKTPSGVKVSIEPRSLPLSHPLATLSGTAKGLRFVAADLGEIIVSGGRGDTVGTAAAGLKDIINLAREKGLLPTLR